jgi:hypothetical protein
MITPRSPRLASLITGLAALCTALPAVAQYSPAPPRPFPGITNDKLRAKDPYAAQWDVGLNLRGRYEGKDDAGFTSAGSNWDFASAGSGNARDNNNHYFLTRAMPRVGYTAAWYQFFVEGRVSNSIDDERDNTATKLTRDRALPENDHDLNLHQAFVFIGNHKQFPLSAKIGRQELVYGEQRQVGHFRWNNNARTFDAAKLRYQNALFGVDAFTGGLVYNDNHNFNQSKLDTDVFSGLYFNFVNIPGVTAKNIVEAYYYNRDVDRDSATENWRGVAAPFRNPAVQDLDVVGLRLKSKPGAYGAWDYGLELMHQFGERATTGPAATPTVVRSAKLLEQDAYAAVAQLGYTWTDHAWQPRLAFIYSYASGDDKATDQESNTFKNLFATTHLHYGYMDLSSLQNLHDYRVAFTFKPHSTVTVALEGHLQYLDTEKDLWYNVAGVGRNAGGYATRGTSTELGQEVDLVVGWYPLIHTHVELGLSHYFAGNYIEESLADNGGAKDASYVYLQLTLNL